MISFAEQWRHSAYNRLTEIFETARRVFFDDSSRFVFFSDCHRGDRGRADLFAQNGQLFLDALEYYFQAGFTYVEVGDGDDVWKNAMDEIVRAYERIFDLFHQFQQQHRLHFIAGNHDIRSRRQKVVEKDGIPADEGLVLQHARTGQQIFVVHGHQVDFIGEQLSALGRLAVRHVWKRLQQLGVRDKVDRAEDTRKQKRLQEQIADWLVDFGQIVICGHTHRPKFAPDGATPYFNTGSCLIPGLLTGLEIQNGEIMQVQWVAAEGGPVRQLLAPPLDLRLFY